MGRVIRAPLSLVITLMVALSCLLAVPPLFAAQVDGFVIEQKSLLVGEQAVTVSAEGLRCAGEKDHRFYNRTMNHPSAQDALSTWHRDLPTIYWH